MVVTRISHVVFATVLIGWGIVGLVKGDLASGWLPVPESMPARHGLAYLCAAVCIAVGVGLLLRYTAILAARVFFIWLLIWLLILRLPWLVIAFGIDHWWSACSTSVVTSAAWVLFISIADDWDREHLGFVVADRGLLIARMLFGLGLIPIGLAHFLYPEATAPLVPAWLQWPLFWAYFTGAAFIAAGLAVITGVLARLASTLITLQIGLLTLLVWVPLAIERRLTPFQWGEFEMSIVLTACAWVVADSYGKSSWLARSVNKVPEIK